MRHRAVLLAVAALVGCSQGANSSRAAAAPRAMRCTAVAPPQLVFPANGAAGVADGNFSLRVRYPHNPSAAFSRPALTSTAAEAVNGGSWSSGKKRGEWAASIAALQPKTHYGVNVTNAACHERYVIGSFATK